MAIRPREVPFQQSIWRDKQSESSKGARANSRAKTRRIICLGTTKDRKA